MIDDTKLKPCPKCNSNNGQAIGTKFRYCRELSDSECVIRCDDCGFELEGFSTEVAAIKAWNNISRVD